MHARRRCAHTAKLVLISNNCPPVRKSEIEYYAMLAKTGVHHYTGSEWGGQGSATFWTHALLRSCSCSECATSDIVVTAPCYTPRAVLADNVDLGTACGKYYRVCVLAITDPGAHGGRRAWCYAVIPAGQSHDAMSGCLAVCVLV